MSASMFITFCICMAAMVTLAAALYLIELAGKRADASLRKLQEHWREHRRRYLAAAYLVLFAAVLLYVVLIALKLSRLERELAELARIAKERAGG